jgi:hypothetical protein
MKKPGPIAFYSFRGNYYPAVSVTNSFTFGFTSGMTSTSSIYSPHIHFSYSRVSPNGLIEDWARIGSDFRTVVSSGSFLVPGERSTTSRSE